MGGVIVRVLASSVGSRG